jgi:SnoaL-like domain
MDEQIVRSVERLMTLFGRYADCGDGERLASLFFPDGTLSLGSTQSTGRSAIATVAKERSSTPGRKTRHV